MADQRCGECLAAHYCSMKCQIADRPLHRLLCSVYRPFLATRPKRRVVRVEQTDYIFDYKLALLFPFEAEEPELIWVEVQVDIDDPEKDWEGHMLDRSSNPSSEMHEIPLPNEEGIALEFNLDKYVPRDTHPESMVVTWEHLFAKNRNLQDFWPFGENESEVGNQCLEKLNEGYSFTGHCSSRYPPKDHGNQVVMRCERVSDYSRKEGKCYHDVTLTDLRLAFNHFSRHNNTFEGAKPNEFYIRQNTDWVKVVKLSSHYERFSKKKGNI
jgi:hypothetical protein